MFYLETKHILLLCLPKRKVELYLAKFNTFRENSNFNQHYFATFSVHQASDIHLLSTITFLFLNHQISAFTFNTNGARGGEGESFTLSTVKVQSCFFAVACIICSEARESFLLYEIEEGDGEGEGEEIENVKRGPLMHGDDSEKVEECGMKKEVL